MAVVKGEKKNKVCFIRLLTGDDLIAEVTKKSITKITIKNPMLILNNVELEENRQTLVLYPWIPQGIAIGNTADVKTENIILINEIEPEIKDYYDGIVELAFATKPVVTSSTAQKLSDLEQHKGSNVVSFRPTVLKDS
jgi:hypothetical protein